MNTALEYLSSTSLFPSLNSDFYGPVQDPSTTFTRATAGACYLPSGLLQSVGNNVPRFDFDPTTHSALGLLLEEARTNICLRASNMTNASWSRTTMTATANTANDPFGTTTYSTITASGANATCLQSITVTSGVAYTFSIDLYRITGSGTVQITMDNGATWTTVTLTSSIQRFSVTQTTGSTTAVVGVRIVTNTDAVGVGSAQLEQGSYGTSRIATTGTSVQRNRDTIQYTLPMPFYGDGNSLSVVVKCQPIANTTGTSTRLFAINDGTSNNQIVLATDASNNLQVTTYVNAVTTTTSTTLALPFGSSSHCGVSISGSQILVAVNGVVSAATFAAPLAIAPYVNLVMGPAASGGCMYLQRFKFFKKPLTAGKLSALTQ